MIAVPNPKVRVVDLVGPDGITVYASASHLGRLVHKLLGSRGIVSSDRQLFIFCECLIPVVMQYLNPASHPPGIASAGVSKGDIAPGR